MPRRKAYLPSGFPGGSGPSLLTDSQGKGHDHAAAVALAGWKIIEPHLGQIDHDAFARNRWQHEARGHHDLGTGFRQPGIHTGIGGHDLVVPQIEATGDVQQGVLRLCHHGDHFPHHVLPGRWQGIDGRSADCRPAPQPDCQACPPQPSAAPAAMTPLTSLVVSADAAAHPHSLPSLPVAGGRPAPLSLRPPPSLSCSDHRQLREIQQRCLIAR